MISRFVVLITLLLSLNAHSGTTIRATIEGSQVRWDNAITVSGLQKVPSFWQPTPSLVPTSQWLPGGLSSLPPSIMALTSSVDTTQVSVSVLGFEYHTGSVTPMKGVPSNRTVCSQNGYGQGVIKVTGGINCGLQYYLNNPQIITPFSFLRPVFSIDETVLSNAFNGKAAGIYRGNIKVSNFYDYDYSGVMTRQYLHHSFALEVTYIPAVIDSVIVSGSNELITRYDLKNDKVSARTQLDLQAKGIFINGLNMSLSAIRNDYQLIGPDLSKINYSIDCLGCLNRSLISDGKVIKRKTKIPSGSATMLNFSLAIFFDDQSLTPLTIGQYSDAFVLIFEPDI